MSFAREDGQHGPGAFAWSRQAATGPHNWLHQRLRMAAALLAEFDPDVIQPVRFAHDIADAPADPALEATARGRLRADANPVGFDEAGQPRLSLHDSIRREALRALGDRATMEEALGCNSPRPDTPLQHALKRLIAGEAVDPEVLSREAAAAMLVAVRWLDGILPHLPERVAIERALARRDLIEQIERLAVGDEFVGRAQELAQLRASLGPTPSGPGQLLLLRGPGGIGKSALAARAVQPEVAAGTLVLWLDFDRTLLDPRRPFSLIREMIRQLAALLPELDLHRLARLSERWEAESAEASDYIASGRSLSFLASNAAQALRPILERLKRRVLLVVDTFEEVQVQGLEAEHATVLVLGKLSAELPGLVVLLCGRAEPRVSGIEEMVLDELAAGEALELLHRLVGDAWGPAVPQIARELGGNPLLLRFAARIIRAEGARTLVSPEGIAQLRAAIREQRLWSMLYGRILTHLHTENARRLAFPGLVLRLITPVVIAEVLAIPCALDLAAPGAAREAYDDLASEITLVIPDPASGGLRHRPDVRRLMLDTLLSFVDPNTVVAIDRGAVEYWSRQAGPVARAEEIYHRLRLGEPREVLDSHWNEAAAPYLTDALEELPARERLWLAERLGATVDPALRREADLADWEAQAALIAESCLRAGDAAQALAVLHERSERRPGGTLPLLELEALRALGRVAGVAEARALAERARALAEHEALRALAAGKVANAAELWLGASLVTESVGMLEDALSLTMQAERAAAPLGDRRLRLRALVTRIRLLRKLGETRDPERHELLREARLLADREMLRRLDAQPTLLYEIVAELGHLDAEILKSGIAKVGLETRSRAERERLVEAMVELGASQERRLGPGTGLDAPSGSIEDIQDWIGQQGKEAITSRVLESIVQLTDVDKAVQESFTKYFQAIVDTNIARDWEGVDTNIARDWEGVDTNIARDWEIGFFTRVTIVRQPKVDWFDVGELTRTTLKVLTSTIVGGLSDRREVMAALDPRSGTEPVVDYDYSLRDAIWIDYVAALGDGWNATYSVACLIGNDYIVPQPADAPHPSVPGDGPLLRGDILVFGGDQVYPVASAENYATRCYNPYYCARPWELSKKTPHLFAIPGNNDWYDGLTSFLRCFCQPTHRWFGIWQTRQRRSYFALKLPHDWWLWAFDVQSQSDVDGPQNAYFNEQAKLLKPGDRIILCTPETWWIEDNNPRVKDPSKIRKRRENIEFLSRGIIACVPTWASGGISCGS
jgi:hypothetical protein